MNALDYSNSFLRYCQDRKAGEFANVGVLFLCPQDRFLGFRGSHLHARLTHFFGDLEDEAEDFGRDLENLVLKAGH